MTVRSSRHSKPGAFQPARHNFFLWWRGHFLDDRLVVIVSWQHSGGILARSHRLESKKVVLFRCVEQR
jgi:hypothetical protein